MKLIISDKKVQNNYDIINYIESCESPNELTDLLNELSGYIQNGNIDALDAKNLLESINDRINVLNGIKALNEINSNKKLTFKPVTSSNKGMGSIILLICNIALTAVMYALLIFSKFIK
jgi:hypothetical protein